jgi:hypothetical protein
MGSGFAAPGARDFLLSGITNGVCAVPASRDRMKFVEPTKPDRKSRTAREAAFGGKLGVLLQGWKSLKFARNRRILRQQTNLSFGFALTHCGETRRNEWAKAHFSFGQDAAKYFYYRCKRGNWTERGHSSERPGPPARGLLRDGVERMAAHSQSHYVRLIVKMLSWRPGPLASHLLLKR